MQHLVVAYDIVGDSRRSRLCQRLKGYLTHVQLSVFEGAMRERVVPELMGLLEHAVVPEEDTLRVYRLCQQCRQRTVLLGLSDPVDNPPPRIILV